MQCDGGVLTEKSIWSFLFLFYRHFLYVLSESIYNATPLSKLWSKIDSSTINSLINSWWVSNCLSYQEMVPEVINVSTSCPVWEVEPTPVSLNRLCIGQLEEFDSIYCLINSTFQLKLPTLWCPCAFSLWTNEHGPGTKVAQPAKTFQSLSVLIRPKRNSEC